MRTAARIRSFWKIAAFASALVLIFASPALAQARDEFGEARQTVARISDVEGSASFSRGDDPDNWQAADQNVPMTIGDRVYTGDRSRLELEVPGGDSIRLGSHTDLAALNLTEDTKQFSVKSGVASFRIRRLSQDEVFEIDTPNAAVTIDQPGDYRVDVDQDGNSRILVRRGHVTVAAGGGQVPVSSGEEMDIDGIDAPRYDVVAAGSVDGWDRWAEQRESRVARAPSLQYVSQDVVGVGDLDQYGRWQQVPDHGWCWAPTVVAADWVPYRVGHWIWQDPWGWTWVSAEPWGWAPYHYGRWVTSSSRWYWVPVAPSVSVVAYSPALVAFVGGGPGFSASITIGGGGFVGWFPLGPRDPLVPWWGRRASVDVNVTNVTYVNKTYVTVVNQNTFVSGGVVTNAVVRDRSVVRQIVAAPVVRGPLSMVPTAASLHVAVRANLPPAPRPPAQVAARSVVARVAPPPAPPTFQAKLAAIKENRGAPISPAQAAKISVENRGRAQAITQVRPAAAEPGRVTLAPRTGASAKATAAKPEPMAPVRGRPQATQDRPVATAPVTSSSVPVGREREAQPAPPREAAPRPTPQAPPVQPQPQRGREQPQRVTPPAEKNIPPPAEKGRPPGQQGESWRDRERPAEAAPRYATPQAQRPTPQPAEGRRQMAPPPQRPTEQPSRGREGAPPLERPQMERTRPPRETPQVRPESERVRERPTPPPEKPTQQPEREGRTMQERPAAAPAREARPQPPPERQVERASPQKPEQKKEEKAKAKEKKKTDEEKKKTDEEKKKEERERKPE